MQRFGLVQAYVVVACLAGSALPSWAQTPSPAPANPNANIVVDNPTYVTIPLEIDVNKPAADVWKRVGKYCDIGEWLQIPTGCKILSGTEDGWSPVEVVEKAKQELGLDSSNFHWCLSRDHHPHLPKHDRPEEMARNVAQIIHLINGLLRDVSVDLAQESEQAVTIASG